MKPNDHVHCYTTGACAAAAVKGAALMLRDQVPLDAVALTLPCGETAHFKLRGATLGENSASCYVLQEKACGSESAGAQIHATVQVDYFTRRRTRLKCGAGVGRMLRPGRTAGRGTWAINPMSRRMIMEVVKEIFALRCIPWTLTLTLSIPNGSELAGNGPEQGPGIEGGIEVRHGE